MHNNIFYPSDQFKYKINVNTKRLEQHIKLILYDEKTPCKTTYPCNQCEFKANWKHNLKQHIEAIHQKITYSCDQCDYTASHKGNLKRHNKTIHANITYQGQPCEYKTKKNI